MKKLTIGLALTVISTFSMAAQECSIEFSKSAPNIRYTFNDNGTIKDKVTGLTWMRCPLGQTWNAAQNSCTGKPTGMFWQAALSEVQSINDSESHSLHQFAGKEKWRMPNIKELVSLAEYSCRTPALNAKAFNGAYTSRTIDGDVTAYVWSNNHFPESSNIMVFDTRNAETYAYEMTSAKLSVLLVAEEQNAE
ncbi:Lcl C-terminal domain-containing protein [Vibrio atypicus]|uniref:Lcl C-terminal domain-containing protein n=1 Tax=Vibrio atypicus TaxID=558271 RepID=UPI00135B9866|nr:DUF1566 domain-containing protein [Vibrio atypicus]